MKFIDSTTIKVLAGKGGDGIVSFMSARGAPKLGPDGGDGGHGGSIVLRGKAQLNTLSALRYVSIYRAEDGVKGGAKGCRGRCGEDKEIPVPLGTMVYDDQTGELLGELVTDESILVVAKGGWRGLGNMHWLSSTHQAPEEYRPGAPGEERELRLELKLLADVGLAGFPNAGKSTLLSCISAARPKIADYPFTTLVPNLGVVDLGGSKNNYYGESFVVADVPGLIEGASEGRGLGLDFLRHLERTSVLAYVLDGSSFEHEPLAALEVLTEELRQYSSELAAKRSVLVLTKLDLLEDDERDKLIQELEARGFEVLPVCSIDGRGLPELKRRLLDLVREERALRGDDKPETVDDDAVPGKHRVRGSLLRAALAQADAQTATPSDAP